MCNKHRLRPQLIAGSLALGVLLCLAVFAIARHGASAPEVSPLDYEADGPGLNVDDPCFWADPVDPAESLLFATTKDSGLVEVFKAATGEFVTTIPGFGKPNNCAVDGDLLLTTDRIAADVKVHHIPDFTLERTFGADMTEPQGIDVLHTPGGQTLVYVTDSGDASVHVYDLPTGALVRSFPTGFGLQIEPIVTDDRYQRIFVSREEGGGPRGIGWFTPEGTLVKEFGSQVFGNDTEGLAIYACGDDGYLIASDQNLTKTQFEIFDRVTLAHLGTFELQDGTGDFTNATDGLDVLQTPLPGFPNGIFAACDGCGATLPDETDVVSWDRIAAVMGLNLCPNKVAPDCVTTPCRERLIASADAYVAADAPDTNFGSAPTLEIDATPAAETLLRFDVADLSGFDVEDATVRLTVATQIGSGAASGGRLTAATGDWTESGVTYDTRPAPSGVPVDTNGPVSGADVVDFDVGAVIRDGGTYDFVLTTSSDDRARYRSREADNGPPTLLLALHASSPPEVTISGPADGAVLPEGVPIALTGSASDPEDGDLSARIAWRSSRDGALGTGAAVTVAALSAGSHTITAEVVDGARLHATASVHVSINRAPAVSITAPADGASVPAGTPLTLSGSALDPEEGDVSANLVWTSDRDGLLGAGASLVVTLREGPHVLTATGTDSGGARGSTQRTVTIAPSPPAVTISAPADGAMVVTGQPVLLSGSASDFTDGDSSSKLVWRSDLQGPLGTGARLTVVALQLGTHRITARVTDSSQLAAEAAVTLRVAPATMQLTAVADAFVAADVPTKNFGSDPTLQADASPERLSLLRFAVTGTAGLRVDRAVLQLTVSTASAANSDKGGAVRRITDTGWQESTVTYNTRPPVDGAALASRGPVAKGELVELDVTPAVTGDGTVTLALVTSSGDAVKYKSRESSSGRPKLILSLRSVAGPNAPPVVAVTAPADRALVTAGTPVTLSASATDFEDGDLSAKLAWSSDLAGPLGTGSPLTIPALAAGTHKIRAEVADSAAQTGAAVITLVVNPSGILGFAPLADTDVSEANPAKNFGAAATLTADASPLRQIFLRFAVSGMSGLTATHATLRLTVGSASGAQSNRGGTVHAISDTGWGEKTLTYSNRPPIDGAALASAGAVVLNQAVDFDVTGAIAGDGVYVFALVTSSSDGVTYASREAPAGAPQLLITTSPGAVPTATPTAAATATVTAAPTVAATPTATATATPVPTATATRTATATPTPIPTATRTVTPATTATATASAPAPTATATPAPSACSAPIVIPAAGGTFTGTTSGASTLLGTCALSNNSPERVFQWTPSTSGTATIATCGSATTFDTVVYVRGGACETGSQVACNDDTAGCTTGEPNDHHGSRLTPTVTAGQTYYIVVDGYDGRTGAFSLSVTPAP